MKGRSRQGLIRLLLCVLLLGSLLLLSEATQNSARFGSLHTWLLLINGVGMVLLVLVIGANLGKLIYQFQRGQPGSRLTMRLMAMLVTLAVVPVSVVYYFSMQFLRSGIESWFDVKIERALQDALDLSQASLDLRMRDLLRRMQQAAHELRFTPDSQLVLGLGDLRERSEASEMALLATNGRVIATSSQDPAVILPDQPDGNLLLQLRQGFPYVGLDPLAMGGLHIRVLVPLQGAEGPNSNRILQALFPISPRMNDLADSVQTAYADYRELTYLRDPLTRSFMITLSLVLFLSLLFAVWTAFYLARRLVAPVRELAEGTRALAAGDYGTQLSPAGRDELGFLVQSFNDMSRRIAQAREAAKRSQLQAEAQRAYLETVMSRLSSGVITLEQDGQLRTANQAASDILGVPAPDGLGRTLREWLADLPHLNGMVAALEARLSEQLAEWREEFALDTPDGRQVLVCNGALLPGGGHVLVLDDVTTLIQAQRDAAWGEVARRLAHEIKNPLTPIQLSAERIRHKYLERMEGKDAEVLERSTRTIVQQVEAMKEMVNAFSDYARPPKLNLQALDVNHLIHEVVELYRTSPEQLEFALRLDPKLPPLYGDPGRLRQLLHNLIKNAQEACPPTRRCEIEVRTRLSQGRHSQMVELLVTDNGPGFPEDVLAKLFEPYVTTKLKGTGLGLAIVKKIVEEHNGSISARNVERGAQLSIRIPVRLPGAGDATDGAPGTNMEA